MGHISIFLFTPDFVAWVLESIPSSIQSITANRLYAMKLLKKQEKSPFTARKSKPTDKNGISQRHKDQACISCMKWTLLLGSLWKVKHRIFVTTSKNQTLHEVIRKCKFQVFHFRFYIFQKTLKFWSALFYWLFISFWILKLTTLFSS